MQRRSRYGSVNQGPTPGLNSSMETLSSKVNHMKLNMSGNQKAPISVISQSDENNMSKKVGNLNSATQSKETGTVLLSS